MDPCTTTFVTAKNQEGVIVGFQINSAGDSGDEYFVQMLPRNLFEGNAKIAVSDGKIVIRSIGIGGPEVFKFKLTRDEELQLKEIIFNFNKKYKGHCEIESGFGILFKATFEEILPLNKREENKRKKSLKRNPIPPKDPKKLEKWKRIFT